MNAAFLLVTTALMTGDVQVVAHEAPVPAQSCGAGCSSYGGHGGYYGGYYAGGGCCDSCDTCCSRPGLLDRLRGMFSRGSCCGGCDMGGCTTSCNSCCQTYSSCCDTCSSGCGGGFFSRCSDPCKPSLMDRLRSMFSRRGCGCSSSCCDSGCGCDYGCGYGGCAGGACAGGACAGGTFGGHPTPAPGHPTPAVKGKGGPVEVIPKKPVEEKKGVESPAINNDGSIRIEAPPAANPIPPEIERTPAADAIRNPF